MVISVLTIWRPMLWTDNFKKCVISERFQYECTYYSVSQQGCEALYNLPSVEHNSVQPKQSKHTQYLQVLSELVFE